MIPDAILVWLTATLIFLPLFTCHSSINGRRQIHALEPDALTSWITSATSSRPNVLFLVVDDLRPSLGCYGENVVTPNIDNLARKSVRFQRAYAQVALCGPSRASFLTSRRPDTTRVLDLDTYWRTVAGNFTSLPQFFKQHGYVTQNVGKIFHPGKASGGRNDYPLSWTTRPYVATDTSDTTSAVNPVNETASDILQDTDLKNFAVDFLQKYKRQRRFDNLPFFLAVGFHKPHLPFKYPQEFDALYPLNKIQLANYRIRPAGMPDVAWGNYGELRKFHDIEVLNVSKPYGPIPDTYQYQLRKGYYAATTYTDSLVGRVLEALDENGYTNNTIIVFFGDHGWQLGECGEWCKQTDLDIATKIPLLISVPGVTTNVTTQGHNYPFINALTTTKNASQTPDPHVTDSLVEAIDIFPTLAQLAGLPVPPTCPDDSFNIALCSEGTSLVPLLRNATASSSSHSFKWKQAVYWQFLREKGGGSRSAMGYTIRTDKYRYTEWVDYNPVSYKADWQQVQAIELYDHSSDPEEIQNLAGTSSYSTVVSSLSKQLRDGWRVTLQQANS